MDRPYIDYSAEELLDMRRAWEKVQRQKIREKNTGPFPNSAADYEHTDQYQAGRHAYQLGLDIAAIDREFSARREDRRRARELAKQPVPPSSPPPPPIQQSPPSVWPNGARNAPYVSVSMGSYDADVRNQSFTKLVVLELGAPDCEASSIATAALEDLVIEGQETWLLAKADVNANPGSLWKLRIHAIPAIAAIFGGRDISTFTTAPSPDDIRQWLVRVIGWINARYAPPPPPVPVKGDYAASSSGLWLPHTRSAHNPGP